MNKSDKSLKKIFKSRLEKLAKFPKIDESKSITSVMEEEGINRRDFMKWAGMMTALLGLSSSFVPTVAKAAKLADRLPVIWLHMAECTGCSESFIRTATPTVDSLIFDYISLDYDDTLMAAAGWQAEANLESSMKKHYGKYILMVEGGIPLSDSGDYLTLGAEAIKGEDRAKNVAKGAAAIFAIGTCSSYGGVQAAAPNPTGAVALSKVISQPVINVPGCPPSAKNIVGSLLHFILFGTLPALDAFNRPKWSYGHRIHDLCFRRGHFDAGEFVEQFGDENAKNGFCLYKVGCKGPYTFNNCGTQKFNQHTSWPIQAGHGCIGCSEPDFWDTMKPYEEPVADHLYQTVFGGLGADATADKVGVGLLSITAIGIAAHAVISSIKKPKE